MDTSTSASAVVEDFLRAVRGEPGAFAAFLSRAEGRIARIVRASVPAADAEDVFQEVCLRLVAKGHLYDPARALTPWLDAVTRQVCAAALRRRRGRAAPEPLEDVAAPEVSVGDPWVRDAVQEHLRRLPAGERQALTLVLLHGLTQREAAARLGVPPGTVATWIAKTVRALRARLGDQP